MLPRIQQECGPMPKVMAALPNIGDALCSRSSTTHAKCNEVQHSAAHTAAADAVGEADSAVPVLLITLISIA